MKTITIFFCCTPLLLSIAANSPAAAQQAFRADVLEVNTHLSDKQDLMATIFNSSKLPTTGGTVAAEFSPSCRFNVDLGSAKAGEVRTVRIASRADIAACQISGLTALAADPATRVTRRGIDISASPGLTPAATLPLPTVSRPVAIPGSVIRTLPGAPSIAINDKSHSLKITVSARRQDQPFTVSEELVLGSPR